MRLLLPLFCCALPLLALSAEAPIPASPASWVTDAAGVLSPQSAQTLDKRLGAYERSSGRQLFVYIGKSTGGVPIEDWAVKAFKIWKVGRKGLDNGVVLFIMVDDRRMRIEVGYGLEGQLTDALTSRIINDVIQPHLLTGDYDEAVTSGVESIVTVLDGKPLAGVSSGTSPPNATPTRPLSIWQLLLYGLIGLAFLALFATNPSFAIYLLVNILSGGRGSTSNSNSGGGFSGGGGGRSGGGGASGSW